MDWTTIILLPHMSSFWSQGEKKKKSLIFFNFKNQQLKFSQDCSHVLPFILPGSVKAVIILCPAVSRSVGDGTYIPCSHYMLDWHDCDLLSFYLFIIEKECYHVLWDLQQKIYQWFCTKGKDWRRHPLWQDVKVKTNNKHSNESK